MTGLEFLDYMKRIGQFDTLTQQLKDVSQRMHRPTGPMEVVPVYLNMVAYNRNSHYKLFDLVVNVNTQAGTANVVSAKEITNPEEIDKFFFPAMPSSKAAEQMKKFIYQKSDHN